MGRASQPPTGHSGRSARTPCAVHLDHVRRRAVVHAAASAPCHGTARYVACRAPGLGANGVPVRGPRPTVAPPPGTHVPAYPAPRAERARSLHDKRATRPLRSTAEREHAPPGPRVLRTPLAWARYGTCVIPQGTRAACHPPQCALLPAHPPLRPPARPPARPPPCTASKYGRQYAPRYNSARSSLG